MYLALAIYWVVAGFVTFAKVSERQDFTDAIVCGAFGGIFIPVLLLAKLIS